MTTQHPLYETANREIHLLDNLAIQGRKTELRQLLKLLTMAKAGQSKTALITGDAGIGKSALMQAFYELVREGVYCRILNLGRMTYDSPEALYVAFIDHLKAEADAVLDEALAAVNEITRELDLHWDRADLVRAIALVKLQESIGGKEAVSQEQLVKAIRSQVPTIKKLKFSINDSIERLVDLIVNPWVMVATSILNPMSPPLQEAIACAERIKNGEHARIDTIPPVNGVGHPLPADPDEPDAETPASETVVHIQADSGRALPVNTEPPDGEAYPDFLVPAVVSPSRPVGLPMRIETAAKPPRNPLVMHLINVFNFINQAVGSIDSGVLVLIDEWDRIQEQPQREALKDFLGELLYQMGEQKNFHFMTVVSTRNEGESYTLGGALFNQFRAKLMLDPLPEKVCRKLVRQSLKEAGASVDEDLHQRLMGLSKGNPYWHLKLTSYIRERVESNRLRHVDTDFFDRLGIETLSGVLELSFTRLKLTFLNDEESLYKVIAALVKLFGENDFSAKQAVREISASQGFTEAYVFEVLRAMYRHDFLRETARTTDPRYAVQGRFVFEFLYDKTRAIETDISTDEKLMYLKKIIPLSVKAGELDREKTLEVLAISDALGNRDIVNFLEGVFLDALEDDRPVVRVTALNNIALIDSDKAREAIFRGMKDEDSMVREYAARNLSLLARQKNASALSQRIIDTLINAIDDDSEAVRAQVYATLSKYKLYRDLTNVFVKGLADASDAVRLTAVQSLVDTTGDSPFVYNAILDAMSDPVPEIRRQACIGLQRYPRPETIEALVTMLKGDAESALRALAADSLSGMPDNRAFQALVDTLNAEESEDVKLAAARALGRRKGWQTEEVLLNALHNLDVDVTPVYAWTTVRSLGHVGGTERSLNLLNDLMQQWTNPILLSAVHDAHQRIQNRIDELRQLERQLEAATPVVVAIPAELQEEVTVVEDEPLDGPPNDVQLPFESSATEDPASP